MSRDDRIKVYYNYRIWMYWTAVAVVLAGLSTLAALVAFDVVLQSGLVLDDYSTADVGRRWLLLRFSAAADWDALRSEAALPALALVIAGAFWRFNSFWYCAAGGCLALGLAPLLVGTAASGAVVAKYAFSGLIGEAIFWLIAGRYQTRGLFR